MGLEQLVPSVVGPDMTNLVDQTIWNPPFSIRVVVFVRKTLQGDDGRQWDPDSVCHFSQSRHIVYEASPDLKVDVHVECRIHLSNPTSNGLARFQNVERNVATFQLKAGRHSRSTRTDDDVFKVRRWGRHGSQRRVCDLMDDSLCVCVC